MGLLLINDDTSGVIPDGPTQAKSGGETIHKGAEADPLDNALNCDLLTISHQDIASLCLVGSCLSLWSSSGSREHYTAANAMHNLRRCRHMARLRIPNALVVPVSRARAPRSPPAARASGRFPPWGCRLRVGRTRTRAGPRGHRWGWTGPVGREMGGESSHRKAARAPPVSPQWTMCGQRDG